MSKNLTKTNFDGYMKDEETGAIINTNYAEYDRFVAQKNQYKEYLKTKEEITDLKAEMAELKRLFQEKIKNE